MGEPGRFYLTTPIYYVNDRPHIGHLYSTTLVDVAARSRRLAGDEVFFLTGTDEHAAKVVEAAAEQGLSVEAWAERNARAFREAFAEFGIANDDFIRTSEPRHKRFVQRAIADLLRSGDVYLGDYEGWYDAGQEEYVPEARARACDHRSPITGRPLVRRSEKNYFFRLSAYEARLLALLEERPDFVQPEARRNEILGRIREGLADVPVSRTGAGDWGVRFPEPAPAPGAAAGDAAGDHMVYVWIDALLNYTSVIDPPERRGFWPADVHVIGKDILWFHAAIWPAVLLALQKVPGNEWLGLPGAVYAHSFWMREGQKMSKSLGNFVGLDELRGYRERFGLDALRWFLATQGPGATVDSDFSESRFIEVYNSELANTVGNAWNRIVHMTGRYLGGRFEKVGEGGELRARAEAILAGGGAPAGTARAAGDPLGLGGLQRGLELVRAIDVFIDATEPFRLAKQPGQEERVRDILYQCAETYRLASLLLWPALPGKMEQVWERMGLTGYGRALADRGRGRGPEWLRWGGLPAGSELRKGEALFPRHVAEEAASPVEG